jgi:hypothetical protein
MSSTEEGDNCKSYSDTSLTVGSDTLISRFGGTSWDEFLLLENGSCLKGSYLQRTNFEGLISSRRHERTNAYTGLILLVEGNTFSN